MKKFLAILLIAIVACNAIEDLDLNDVLDYLRNAGIFDMVKNKLIAFGKKVAIDLCANYISRGLCEAAVNVLASMI